jgi:hypothetical protein
LSQQQPVATSLLHQSQPQQQQQQQQHEEDGESDWAGSDVDSFMQGRYVHPDDPAFPFEDDEDELYVGGALDDLDELFDGIDSAGMAGGGWLHPAPGSSAAGGGQAGGMYISAPPPLPDADFDFDFDMDDPGALSFDDLFDDGDADEMMREMMMADIAEQLEADVAAEGMRLLGTDTGCE